MNLGTFTIERYIASGAAGSVWTGRHARNGTPVALKVLQPDGMGGTLPEDVRTELEALGGMAHPNIVWLYDFGRVRAGVRTATGEELPEGGIWLAMELAESTLKDPGPVTWPVLQTWIDQLLDALGYAHARGVLHRDVKPQNVLLSGPDRTIKLSDFGIAVLHGHTRHVASGTMYYMAPEQELGDLPQLGPPTDLFALGVMVWRMVCGQVPYENRGATLLFPKMRNDLLPFEPQFSVPRDLEGWLRSCLKPAPADRFACAADARYALESLPSIFRSALPRARDPDDEDTATVVQLATSSDPIRATGTRPPPAPMVTTWRRREVSPPHLLNAGLELFGMRAFPTVGRELEREVLWRCLVDVRRSGAPRVALISGAPGMGRKHLARWLGERAAETGAANLQRLSFSGGAGLLSWLQSELLCTSTDPDTLTQALDAHEARWGSLPPAAVESIHRSLRDRVVDPGLYEAFAAVLALHCADRPVVVLLQNATTPECWNAVRAVMEHETRMPVLFAASVRQDLRDRVPEIDVQSIELEPLEENDRVPFIRQLLGLEPALAVRLARVTGGSPGFAIRVCDHWARKGVLEPGPRGYQLREGESDELPTADSWVEQLEEILVLNPAYENLLGVAALLGPDVNGSVWAEASDHPDATGPLLAELVRRRLARRTETGWTFSQAAFREAVLADLGIRMPVLAGRCADVLGTRTGNEELLAWCLLKARRWNDATTALFTAAERAADHGRFHDVIDLMDHWPEVSRERNFPAHHRLHAEALIIRLKALQSLARVPVLVALCEECLEVAPRHGWRDVEAWARILLARWHITGDARMEPLERALALLVQEPRSPLHAEAYLELAQVERDRGHLELAVRHNETATAIARELGLATIARFQSDHAQSLATLERYDEALALAKAAETGAIAAEGVWVQATAVYQQAVIIFLMDDLPAAQAEFERSMLLCRRIGDGHEWFLRAHVGLALRMQGDRVTSREHFEACLRAPIRYGDFIARLGLLTIETDDDEWNTHLDVLYTRYIDAGHSDRIFARMLEVAGDHCLEGGRLRSAARAYTAARQQRIALGSPVDELDAVLAKLPSLDV